MFPSVRYKAPLCALPCMKRRALRSHPRPIHYSHIWCANHHKCSFYISPFIRYWHFRPFGFLLLPFFPIYNKKRAAPKVLPFSTTLFLSFCCPRISLLLQYSSGLGRPFPETCQYRPRGNSNLTLPCWRSQLRNRRCASPGLRPSHNERS